MVPEWFKNKYSNSFKPRTYLTTQNLPVVKLIGETTLILQEVTNEIGIIKVVDEESNLLHVWVLGTLKEDTPVVAQAKVDVAKKVFNLTSKDVRDTYAEYQKHLEAAMESGKSTNEIQMKLNIESGDATAIDPSDLYKAFRIAQDAVARLNKSTSALDVANKKFLDAKASLESAQNNATVAAAAAAAAAASTATTSTGTTHDVLLYSDAQVAWNEKPKLGKWSYAACKIVNVPVPASLDEYVGTALSWQKLNTVRNFSHAREIYKSLYSGQVPEFFKILDSLPPILKGDNREKFRVDDFIHLKSLLITTSNLSDILEVLERARIFFDDYLQTQGNVLYLVADQEISAIIRYIKIFDEHGILYPKSHKLHSMKNLYSNIQTTTVPFHHKKNVITCLWEGSADIFKPYFIKMGYFKESDKDFNSEEWDNAVSVMFDMLLEPKSCGCTKGCNTSHCVCYKNMQACDDNCGCSDACKNTSSKYNENVDLSLCPICTGDISDMLQVDLIKCSCCGKIFCKACLTLYFKVQHHEFTSFTCHECQYKPSKFYYALFRIKTFVGNAITQGQMKLRYVALL